jgi:hypothetical protein
VGEFGTYTVHFSPTAVSRDESGEKCTAPSLSSMPPFAGEQEAKHEVGGWQVLLDMANGVSYRS